MVAVQPSHSELSSGMENLFGFSFCAVFFLHYLLQILAGLVSWYSKSALEKALYVTVSVVTLGLGEEGLWAYLCGGAALLYLGYIMFDEDHLAEMAPMVLCLI